MNKSILHINSSARSQDSLTSKMSGLIVSQLTDEKPQNTVQFRDVGTGVTFLDESWIGANFTPPDQRTSEQKQALLFSDTLVNELQQADYIVIGSPIYNFSIPATLKAWIDMVARAGVTFKYTENGPEGLLKNKKVFITIASGGVKIGEQYDFASNYLKHIMGFMGLTDVTIINVNDFDLNTGNLNHVKDQVRNIVQ